MKTICQGYPDLQALAAAVGKRIAKLSEQFVREKGTFSLVLSGGKTPQLLYEKLVSSPLRQKIQWAKIHFFWGDERCVPPDHPESNFALAYGRLLSKLSIPPGHIHRIQVEEGPPEGVAREYEQCLREFFIVSGHGPISISQGGEHFPLFDLILLGMGDDGHTASLFPGDPALEEKERWVVAINRPAGKPPVPRVTLTLPVINMARNIFFLVSGPQKADIIRTVMADPEMAAECYPAARVKPAGDLIWFVENEAT